jgi:hypothetical protein
MDGKIVYKPRLVLEALHNPFAFGVYFRIGRTGTENPDKVVEVAKPLEFQEYIPGQMLDPAFELDSNEADIVINELWRCGYRPTGLRDYLGELNSHIETLKDMVRFLTGQLKTEAAAHLKVQFIKALKDAGIEIPAATQQPETPAEGEPCKDTTI